MRRSTTRLGSVRSIKSKSGCGETRIAHFRPSGGQRQHDGTSDPLRRQAAFGLGPRQLAQAFKRRAERCTKIRRDIDFFALRPNRRRYGAGPDDNDVDAEREELAAEAFRQTFDREFRRIVGRAKGQGDATAHRTDINDAARRTFKLRIGAEQRGECLGRYHHANEIDLDLMTKLRDRQLDKWTEDSDAGIVDQAGKLFAAELGPHLRGGRIHRRFIGHVEEERHEGVAELRREAFGIGGLAHAAEDAETVRNQNFRGAPADAGGSSRDDDAAHLLASSGADALTGARTIPIGDLDH